MEPIVEDRILLEKAKRTHRLHSHGYANTWGLKPENQAFYRATGRPYTGDLSKDYNCTVEDLAKAFAETHCPICRRSYASMAEGKTGRMASPQWHQHWHLWFPDWIVVCPSCHRRLEGKPASEWGELKSISVEHTVSRR